MTKIPVLDKGFVRLVDHMGSDLTVCNAARVSFAKDSQWETVYDGVPSDKIPARAGGDVKWLSDKDARLIRYLAMHEHWTPFGHPQITLHFKWPVFVGRQAMRSNIGICWNEVSRRYVDDTPEFHEPEVWRGRPKGSIKQGSGEPIDNQSDASAIHRRLCLQSEEAYHDLMALGVCPEQARGDLLSHLYTECWGTFSLAALARFYKLRSDSHAQKEIQDYSHAIDKLVRPLFPVSWPALAGEE